MPTPDQDPVTGVARRLASPADAGPVVRRRRQAQGLRIDDLAALTGVSVDLLSRLENGKGAVRLDKLLTVLDGLGLALAIAPKDHPWIQELCVVDPPRGANAPR